MDAEEKKLHVKLAYGYYQNKEYKKALELYKRLYESDPEDVNVLSMIGDTYLKGKNGPKALEAYSECLTLFEKKENFEKVIKLIKKILRTFPDDQRTKTKLATIMRVMIRDAEKKSMNHDYDGAREIYESIKDFNSEEFPINIKLKEINDEESKQKTREMKIKSQQKKETTGGQNELIGKFEKMAENYLSNGDYDGAVETYITALKLAPNNKELRTKLHNVYVMVANKGSGENVWEKIEGSPATQLEEAKRKALEERQQKIMEEEESRARILLEQEAKIQREYEEQEMEIIQTAAGELKYKLEEAQKKQKLKEEEIQRIMKEQEEKKQSLLEKIKREAVEKFKKQKEAIQGVSEKPKQESQSVEIPKAPEPLPPVSAAPAQPESEPIDQKGIELPSFEGGTTGKKSLADALKGAYAMPSLNQAAINAAKIAEENKDGNKAVKEKIESALGKPAEENVQKTAKSKIEEIIDGDSSDGGKKDDITVTEDTLDSLVTTAFIYINQNLLKEALHIYNKIVEKYPDNPEAKQILKQVTRQEKAT